MASVVFAACVFAEEQPGEQAADTDEQVAREDGSSPAAGEEDAAEEEGAADEPQLPDEIGGDLPRDEDGNIIDRPGRPANDSPEHIYGPVPEHWKKLPGQATWVDSKNGAVIFDGRICRKTGLLEMLICTGGFKEHESVIAAYTQPSVVTAALMLVKAEPGGPAEFEPEFKPAHGTIVDIAVRWMEGDEEVEVPAQDLVIDVKTQEVLDLNWVFAGSGFWKGVDGGPERFIADHGGEFVCVSNFPGCVLDIPVELSASNELLTLTPHTERIPPVGTKVRVILEPRVPKQDGDKAAADADEE
ncbi:MAG: hypothetical protein DWQ31_09415 [Planctomycetota bacterium]|nr:MAG: hypothetical protein DWQ31_09415 [Planctomycetota bacterium]REJ96532.1 MAG: hypothetical protein DWQ35_04090 [Planctomycetota bacterium]REK21785.1 MAG: hypothetical protein DWQ42_19080 [Planctomycetota bacterium]REK43190.1 MAG: hypothetical protein DWQ46_12520 [Planctomycetota bacterium]